MHQKQRQSLHMWLRTYAGDSIYNKPAFTILPPGDGMLNLELERYENAALAALALFEQDTGT